MFETKPCPDVSKVLKPFVRNVLPYGGDEECEHELVCNTLYVQFSSVGYLLDHIRQHDPHHVEEHIAMERFLFASQ